MPIMLSRNLNVRRGLCNGTRAVVLSALPNLLRVRIMSGALKGQMAFLPRITIKHEEDDRLSLTFSRKQFPVQLAFASTINKSQGQTLRRASIYLAKPVFSHGQLYVAVSRVGDPAQLQIYAPGGRNPNDGHVYTANVVWREVLI
jgi:ATP-dependent DNA helicase PIF1